jgi:hypothetical protein
MRASRFPVLTLIAVMAWGWQLLGQETGLLVASRKVVVSGYYENVFIDPARCDAAGNIYLKRLESAPVTKISPDGRTIAQYSLDLAPDPQVKGGSFYVFALNDRGELFAVVHTDKEIAFILKFDKDGSYEGTVKLNATGIFPYHLAVFPTGEFLLAGIAHSKEGEAEVPSAYTAIFDPRGELVKVLSLAQDVSREDAAAEAGSMVQGEPHAADVAFQSAIGSGDAFIGPEGHAYLIRNSGSPVVYVISAYGTVVRRLVLQAPDEALWPTGAPSMAAGKLVVTFAKKGRARAPHNPELYAVYDAQTGEHLIDYKASPELAGGMLCYTPNGFIFAGTQDRQMALISATTR